MKPEERIMESLKESFAFRHYFDRDCQNGEETLKINTTEDILEFIKQITLEL